MPAIYYTLGFKYSLTGSLILQHDVPPEKSLKFTAVGLNFPPENPEHESIYFVGISPRGAWAGQKFHLALFDGGVWKFAPLPIGQVLETVDCNRFFWKGTFPVRIAF